LVDSVKRICAHLFIVYVTYNKMRAYALYEIQLSFVVVILYYRLYSSFVVSPSVPYGEIAL